MKTGDIEDSSHSGKILHPDNSISDILVEKQALLKIDLRIMPLLAISYLATFITRSNISNARISNVSSNRGLDSTLAMTDAQYQFAVSAFFISYIAFQTPANIILKYISPSRGLSTLLITMGIASVAQSFVSNYIGLVVCRLIVGVLQAGFFPGVCVYLTYWYADSDRSFRLALFMCSQPLSGFLSGFIAYSVSHLDGTFNLEGWRWIFIFGGILPIIMGIIGLFVLPDYPEASKFLNEKHQKAILARLDQSGANKMNEAFNKSEFYAAITSPQVYVFCILNFLRSVPFYAFTFTFPTILFQMGYTDLNSQLVSTPPYLAALVASLIASRLSDKYKTRIIPISISAFIQTIGFIGMLFLPTLHLKYAASFFVTMGMFSGGPSFLAWCLQQNMGSTRTAIVSSMVIATGSIGGVVSPFIYSKQDAPVYAFGNTLNLIFASSNFLICILLFFGFRYNWVR